MFFGSRFGNRFWRFLGGVLEANMGPKTSQNGVRKGSEKKVNFEDDFGRRQGGPRTPPGLLRTLQNPKHEASVAGLDRAVLIVLIQFESLRRFRHALRHWQAVF